MCMGKSDMNSLKSESIHINLQTLKHKHAFVTNDAKLNGVFPFFIAIFSVDFLHALIGLQIGHFKVLLFCSLGERQSWEKPPKIIYFYAGYVRNNSISLFLWVCECVFFGITCSSMISRFK